MSIQVKLFGALADVTGKTELELQDIPDINGLKEKMFSDFPSLKKHSFVIALAKKIITGNHELKDGDIVALLPPFAGG